MLDQPADVDLLRSYDTVLVGGASFDPALRARADEAGVRVVSTYGMSETSGGCVYDGMPLDGVAVKIGADGLVRLAGPVLFDGYDGDPELTASVMEGGWFVTSDLGEIDHDGRLRVLGRSDDVVNTGGVKVPASAVARRLRAHPSVTAAEVVGVPDPEWGERVVAVVVGALGLDEARDWVAAEQPRTWAPRELVAGGRDSPAGQREGRPTRPEGAAVKVYSIPLRTRFRGIDVREGVLLDGPEGWGEFSPFLEYGDPEAAPWLRSAIEAAVDGWPPPVRDLVPVNVTVPAVPAEQAHTIVTEGGCATAKVKVAEPGQTIGDDERRVEAVRDAIGPDGAIRVDANGGWDGRRGGDRDPAARPGGRWAGVRRAAVCRGRGPRRRTTRGRRADRGGRVDPAGRGSLPGARPARRRHRGAEGAAARRGACLPAHRRGDRVARGGVERAGDVGRDRRRRRAGRRAAGAALRVRAGDGPAAHRRRDRHAAAAGRRRAAGGPADAVARGARPARGGARPGGALGGPAAGGRRLVR